MSTMPRDSNPCSLHRNAAMRPGELLQQYRAPLPSWLLDDPTSRFCREAFFSSRVVFYPGSGLDGQPVKLFGGSHAAHCFVYVDQSTSAERLRAELRDTSPGRFRGYRVLMCTGLEERQLSPMGWTQHLSATEVLECRRFQTGFTRPFGMYVVLEREPAYNDQHGPVLIAILFLGADAFATFDAIWCQGQFTPPYAIVVQDHGFGGNWSRFGRGGALECLAARCQVWPRWLLVAEQNSNALRGYIRASEPGSADGGQHGFRRTLFRQDRLE